MQQRRFFGMGVSVESEVGAASSVAVLVAIPLALVGGLAQGAESLHRRRGLLTASGVPTAVAD